MRDRARSIRHTASSGMAYMRRGQGRTVVLLHGWCLSHRMWLYQEELLAREFDVVSPDMAGFGLSGDLAGPYTLERYARDIGGLLDELAVEAPVVVGFAFGAAVAMQLASEQPERLGGIVSIGVPSAACLPYDRMPKSMRRDWPDFAARSAAALFHGEQSAATLNWIAEMFRSTRLSVAIETVELLGRFEPSELAGKVSAPQLFIHGSEDKVSPVAIGEACAALTRQARVETVANCGHLVVLDQKEEFHRVIGAYLRSL